MAPFVPLSNQRILVGLLQRFRLSPWFQCLQCLRHRGLGTDLVPCGHNLPLFIDEERGTVDPLEFLAIHRFLPPYAVIPGDLAVYIRKKRESKSMLFSKLFLCGRRVRTDPYHSHFQSIERRPGIPQANRLDRSARRPSFRVEEEKNFVSPKI